VFYYRKVKTHFQIIFAHFFIIFAHFRVIFAPFWVIFAHFVSFFAIFGSFSCHFHSFSCHFPPISRPSPRYDSRYGNLYISDATGANYSLSLLNHARSVDGATDFHRVEGVEGVFVAVVTLQGAVFIALLGQNRPRVSFWYQKSADLVLFCRFSAVFVKFWEREKNVFFCDFHRVEGVEGVFVAVWTL
jgi:hypothetical protein